MSVSQDKLHDDVDALTAVLVQFKQPNNTAETVREGAPCAGNLVLGWFEGARSCTAPAS